MPLCMYLDVWVSQYELPKGRIKCKTIYTISCAKHELQLQSLLNQHHVFMINSISKFQNKDNLEIYC